jgi:hypothetical protein
VWPAEVEAIMAARKRKARYPDVLEKPFQLQRPASGLWLREYEIRRQVGRAWSEKFDLLKTHYGIGAEDPDRWEKLALCLISDHERGMLGAFLKSYGNEVKDPKYWQGLAISLACNHVPGLKILPAKPGRPPKLGIEPKTGKLQKWGFELAQEYVRTIDDLKEKGRRAKDAISEAAKRMGIHLTSAGTLKSPGTLENLYRRSKDMIRPRPGTPLGTDPQ